ncbi:MAG TPA: hypothetical protein VHL98_14445 [Microvirga sp.]|jgi:hypothetical protein|nr:hypothetical protein [Microvirga sp.]
MLQVLRRLLRRWFAGLAKPGPSAEPRALTAVEYEAVSLIAYEGRNAYARAREQARYCRSRGSEAGCLFWTEVAAEVALRTRGRSPERQ